MPLLEFPGHDMKVQPAVEAKTLGHEEVGPVATVRHHITMENCQCNFELGRKKYECCM